MADVDHPKTHVENQKDVDLPRKQPESPKREGIDPLTEGDTMYPATDTKSDSEWLARKEAGDVDKAQASDDTTDKATDTVADQKVADEKADTTAKSKAVEADSSKEPMANNPASERPDTPPKRSTSEAKTSSR